MKTYNDLIEELSVFRTDYIMEAKGMNISVDEFKKIFPVIVNMIAKKFPGYMVTSIDKEKDDSYSVTIINKAGKEKNVTVRHGKLVENDGKFAGWIAFYNNKKLEITKDQAKDLWGAKQLAISTLKVPKSKQGLLAIKPAYESVQVDDDENVDDLDELKRDTLLKYYYKAGHHHDDLIDKDPKKYEKRRAGAKRALDKIIRKTFD